MVSPRIVAATLAFLGIALSTTLATDYVVGDKSGWRLNIDYQAWAKGKVFRVGDKLIFRYPPGFHNVIEVDKGGFQACKAPSGAKVWKTGNDVIELKKRGIHFYICGVAKHCSAFKQKLAIKVVA